MAVVWDEDKEATFIDAYRDNPCLYDKADVNFKDKDLKQQAWDAVAEKCKVSAAAAKDKWKNLRDSFVREKKKKNAVASGSAGGAIKDPKWVHFRAMGFIEPHLAARKTGPAKRARKMRTANQAAPPPPPPPPPRSPPPPPPPQPPEHISEPELTPIKTPKPRRRTRMAAMEAMQRIEECNAAIREWKREGRPFRMRRDALPPSPTPEEAEEDREWEVESLLDVKEEAGVLFYNIKWRGYEEPSWEPVGNLNCPAIRERFDRVYALSFDWEV